MCLVEGRKLTIPCFYNITLCNSSLKSSQWVGSQGHPETLLCTNTRNRDLNWVQDGRYLLEDFPPMPYSWSQ